MSARKHRLYSELEAFRSHLVTMGPWKGAQANALQAAVEAELFEYESALLDGRRPDRVAQLALPINVQSGATA